MVYSDAMFKTKPAIDSRAKLPTGYTVSPDYDNNEVMVRRAYKPHRCDGGWNKIWNEVRKCYVPIESGAIYVTTQGKSYGYKHHLDCAVERGLLEKET